MVHSECTLTMNQNSAKLLIKMGCYIFIFFPSNFSDFERNIPINTQPPIDNIGIDKSQTIFNEIFKPEQEGTNFLGFKRLHVCNLGK